MEEQLSLEQQRNIIDFELESKYQQDSNYENNVEWWKTNSDEENSVEIIFNVEKQPDIQEIHTRKEISKVPLEHVFLRKEDIENLTEQVFINTEKEETKQNKSSSITTEEYNPIEVDKIEVKCDNQTKKGNYEIFNMEIFDDLSSNLSEEYPHIDTQYKYIKYDLIQEVIESVTFHDNEILQAEVGMNLEYTPYEPEWKRIPLNTIGIFLVKWKLIILSSLFDNFSLCQQRRNWKKRRKRYFYDSKIIEKEFKVGDYAVNYSMRLHIHPAKLESKWEGPFKVLEVHPTDPYFYNLEDIL